MLWFRWKCPDCGLRMHRRMQHDENSHAFGCKRFRETKRKRLEREKRLREEDERKKQIPEPCRTSH